MKRIHSLAGVTLAELLFASVIGLVAVTAAYSGAITLQRTLVASEEFTADKSEQARLSDYLALDLRRAIDIEGPSGDILVTITLPDYYDDAGDPISPKVVKNPGGGYSTQYGPNPIEVIYRKVGSAVTRSMDGEEPVVIASNVADFTCLIEPVGGTNFVRTKISFTPSFQRSGTPSAQTKEATTVHNTIRLRNKL